MLMREICICSARSGRRLRVTIRRQQYRRGVVHAQTQIASQKKAFEHSEMFPQNESKNHETTERVVCTWLQPTFEHPYALPTKSTKWNPSILSQIFRHFNEHGSSLPAVLVIPGPAQQLFYYCGLTSAVLRVSEVNGPRLGLATHCAEICGLFVKDWTCVQLWSIFWVSTVNKPKPRFINLARSYRECTGNSIFRAESYTWLNWMNARNT